MLDAETVCGLMHAVCEKNWSAAAAEQMHPASAHSFTVGIYIAAVKTAKIQTTEAKLAKAILAGWSPGDVFRHPHPDVVVGRLTR